MIASRTCRNAPPDKTLISAALAAARLAIIAATMAEMATNFCITSSPGSSRTCSRIGVLGRSAALGLCRARRCHALSQRGTQIGRTAMLPQQVAEGLVGELLPRLHRISRQEVEGLPGFLVEFYQLAPRRRRIFRRAHADSDLDPAHGPRNKRATRPIVHERSIKTGPRAAWN